MGFTAFTYLTQKAYPIIVGTYAYVNPIIALLIGIILGKEVISKLTLIASIILILATILLLTPEEYIPLKTNKKAK
jgi:drug/metabolite transporter (DMT)-like permease